MGENRKAIWMFMILFSLFNSSLGVASDRFSNGLYIDDVFQNAYTQEKADWLNGVIFPSVAYIRQLGISESELMDVGTNLIKESKGDEREALKGVFFITMSQSLNDPKILMLIQPEYARRQQVSQDKNIDAMGGKVGISVRQRGVTLCWFNDERWEKMIERKVSNMCELEVINTRDTDNRLEVNVKWEPSYGSSQCTGSVNMQFGIDRGKKSFIEFQGTDFEITYGKRDYTKEKVTGDMLKFIREFCQ